MGRKTRGQNTDIGQLGRALKAPGFETGEAELGTNPTDPVSPAMVVLSLAEIKPYENNPRQAENPEYHRLKASIQARRGLTTPLTVTQRPGEALYTIAAGGNSRLRVLQELLDETGDPAFAQATCRFEPWESECQVLANHLIENDIRGNMTFADKARAVAEWRRLHAEAHPEEAPLSQRQLTKRLKAAGFRVSPSLLGYLLFAAEHLLALLPKAFASGLGSRQVRRLIRLRDVAKPYWNPRAEARGTSPSVDFETVFTEACLAEDRHADDWSYDYFQAALAARIAEALSLNQRVVAVDLNRLYKGESVPSPDAEVQDPQSGDNESGWAHERAREALAVQTERASVRAALKTDEPSEESPEALLGPSSPARQWPTSPVVLQTESDLERCRQENYALAKALAARHGLGALVMPCSTGLGFFIEAPAPPREATAVPRRAGLLANSMSRSSNGSDRNLALWIWWVVCLCAEELMPGHLSVIRQHAEGCCLADFLERLPERLPQQDLVGALGHLVGVPHWLGVSHDFFCADALADQDFMAVLELQTRCRRLHKAAREARIPLWDNTP